MPEDDFAILGYDEDDDDLMGDDFEIGAYGDVDGDDDLMGDYDDDDDLMGRRRRRRSRSRSRRGSSRLRRRFRRKTFTEERGLVLGFGTQAAVAAGATVDFSANPQVPFQPKRVIIDTGNTAWEVDDVKIGKNSQLASAGGVPASAFGPTAVDVGIKFDSAVPGIDIVITVTNNDAGAQTCTIAMIGYAATK